MILILDKNHFIKYFIVVLTILDIPVKLTPIFHSKLTPLT